MLRPLLYRRGGFRYCGKTLARGCSIERVKWCPARSIEKVELLFQRLANAICDHCRPVVDGARHGTLKPVRTGNEQAEAILERVGRNPCFVGRAEVFAAGNHRSLDAFSVDVPGCL